MEHNWKFKNSEQIFAKKAKTISWIKYCLCNKWPWKNWMTICKINNTDSVFTHATTIYSEWTVDLNAKCKTIKLMEENLWVLIWWSVYDRIPKAWSIKETKTGNLEFIKMKWFCSVKYTVKIIKYNEQIIKYNEQIIKCNEQTRLHHFQNTYLIKDYIQNIKITFKSHTCNSMADSYQCMTKPTEMLWSN